MKKSELKKQIKEEILAALSEDVAASTPELKAAKKNYLTKEKAAIDKE